MTSVFVVLKVKTVLTSLCCSLCWCWLSRLSELSSNGSLPVWLTRAALMSLPVLAKLRPKPCSCAPATPQPRDPRPLTSHSQKHPQPLKPRGPTINPSSCQKLWSYETSRSPPFSRPTSLLAFHSLQLSDSYLWALFDFMSGPKIERLMGSRLLWDATIQGQSNLYLELSSCSLATNSDSMPVVVSR